MKPSSLFKCASFRTAGLLLGCCCLFTAADSALGQTVWKNQGMGEWVDPDNWSTGLPNLLTGAEISNGGTSRLIDDGAADFVRLGSNSGGTGALEVSGGQLQLSLTRSGRLWVGEGGTGALSINGGGGVEDRNGYIGVQDNSTGTARVSGHGSSWTNTEQLFVGLWGTGTLNIQDGGQVMNNSGQPPYPTSASIGDQLSGHGTVTVAGPGSTFVNANDLEVGSYGAGSLSITGGAAASNDNGNIGVRSGSSGLVAVDGPGSVWLNYSVVAVGISGAGALHVTGGAAVENTLGRIGREAGSSGAATVDGPGSTWTSSSDLSVGHFGAGALAITAGGRVSNGNANIGSGGGSSGVATVDGAGSVWTNSSVLAVGSSGVGALNITGGGAVSSFHGRVSRSSGSSGVVVIDGPGSRWDASGAFTMGLLGTGTSSLTVQNGGVLSVAAGMAIGALGTVRGDGTIVADIQNTTGVIAPSSPGTSLGTLHVMGNYTQSFGGTLEMELASPTSFDMLTVTGTMTLPHGSIAGGGSLEVSLADGYVPYGSQSFDILDWGNLSGSFDSVQLPTLGGALAWDTSQLYTTGALSVTGPAPPPLNAALFDLIQPNAAGPPYPSQAVVADLKTRFFPGQPYIPGEPITPVHRLKLSLFDAFIPSEPHAPMPIQVAATDGLDGRALNIGFRLAPDEPMAAQSSIDVFFELEAHPEAGTAPVLIPSEPTIPGEPSRFFDVMYYTTVNDVGLVQQTAHFEIAGDQPLLFTNMFVGPPQSPAFHVTFDLLQTGDEVLTDEDLFTVTIAAVVLAPADFNEDGQVDSADLAAWNAGFGATTGSAKHMGGDANGDLDVDGSDFLTWQRQLHNGPSINAAMAVPEPFAATQWFAGFLFLGACHNWNRFRHAVDRKTKVVPAVSTSPAILKRLVGMCSP